MPAASTFSVDNSVDNSLFAGNSPNPQSSKHQSAYLLSIASDGGDTPISCD